VVGIGHELDPLACVEERGRLGRGASRGLVEASLVSGGDFAGALRDVEHDGQGSSAELIGEVGSATWKPAEKSLGEDEKVEGQPVDVETLVVELHALYVDASRAQLRALAKKQCSTRPFIPASSPESCGCPCVRVRVSVSDGSGGFRV
jgi:hypothetical protein